MTRRIFRIFGVLATTTCLSQVAFAQTDSTAAKSSTGAKKHGAGLEEIVVTANKRSENLQKVPVAITAISSTQLANRSIFQTSDLNSAMPNLQVTSAYGSQEPNFTLRGIGVGTELSASAASPVGVYIDEVYQSFRATHGQQLYDLEQVEVVKGPQGTLYGRNTTGGAVNFITRKPALQGTNGNVTVGYGNYARKNTSGALEFTPVKDKVGVRISGMFLDSDPYIHNLLPAGVNTSAANGASGLNGNTGRDPGGDQSYGARGILRVKPIDGLDITLKGYSAKTVGGVAAPIPTGQYKNSDVINYQYPSFVLSSLFTQLGPNGAGLLPATYSQLANGLGINQIEQDTVGKAITRSEGVSLTVKADLAPRLKLTAITGYDTGKYQQTLTDIDGTPLRLAANGYKSTSKSFNQDLRLDYTWGRFKAIVGGYYGHDAIKTDNNIDIFNFLSDVRAYYGLPSTYFNPNGAFNGAGLATDALPTGVRAEQSFKQLRNSYAVYSEGSYRLTHNLNLTMGARYTMDRSVYRDGLTTYYDDAGNPRMLVVSGYGSSYLIQPVTDAAGNVVIPATDAPYPDGLYRKGNSNKMTGRAILDWTPIRNVMLYASYSRGYRAGTFNGLTYVSSDQVYFAKPEQVNAYEVGFKTRFFYNRLQMNGSLFYYDYTNQQSQVVDSHVVSNIISLDGTVKGAEFDARLAATDTLTLSASVGVLHTAYKGTNQAQCEAENLSGRYPAQNGSCVQSGAGNVSVGGNPFPYAPKVSANLGFDWDAMRLGPGVVKLHGDASYTGKYYYDVFKNYSRGVLPTLLTGKYADGGGDYWLLNARLSYVTKSFTVAAWAKNLTNKLYYPAGYPNESILGIDYLIRGEPRMYGVEATARF